MSNNLFSAVIAIIITVSIPNISDAAFPIQGNNIAANNNFPVAIQNEPGVEKIITHTKQWPDTETTYQKKGKKLWVAAVLAFFFGTMGLHRFYLGYTTLGIMQSFTLPLSLVLLVIAANAVTVSTVGFFLILLLAAVIIAFCFWEISDFIRILVNDLKPRTGNYVKGKGK